MPRIGVHVSIQGSIEKAIDRASERKCDTFQLFTRNPRQWRFKELGDDKASAFLERMKTTEISPVVAHMPYLPNIASPRKTIHEKSVLTLKSELQRCGQLEIPYLVTHLGSHMGTGYEVGIRQALKAIDIALSEADNNVMLLLENTAGTRNGICSTFEEIQTMIDKNQRYEERIGICFDTCHAFAAGYDLRSEDAVETTIDLFDKLVGAKRLKVIHTNDSEGDLHSGRDRHQHIGLGKIGENGFRALLHHRKLRALSFIMETPVDSKRDDYENIKKLRELAE